MKFAKYAKYVLIALALLAVVFAVGCGSKKAGAKCKPDCAYTDMTIGFIQTGSEGGWRAANTASFNETAAQLGIKLKFYDAQNKFENQISAFRNFIQDPDVNVIVLAALEAAGWDEVLQGSQGSWQAGRP